ncbi:MAG: MobC family plasmid mobilization relaxosome protein [Oscillospiraceae bacterium]|nr:MobC family plasmid mobilization relaxosome protein [Oscillospiraceae bacterium]
MPNVNQIARRVNSGGGVYPDGVDEITAKLAEAGGLFGIILEQLSKIK